MESSTTHLTYSCEAPRLGAKPGVVRSRGVAVLTICPGFIATPLTARNPYRMPFLIDADDAARRIARAVRPILYVGGGTLNADACAELQELAEVGQRLSRLVDEFVC